jgi:phosphatidylserine decarboxylase
LNFTIYEKTVFLTIIVINMLTRYGTDNIIVMLAISAILIIVAILFTKGWMMLLPGVPGVVLLVFTLWFFRDPDRVVPQEAIQDKSIVISPADGRVVQIIDIENEYIGGKAKQISIFLSPLDVHVNRIPFSGVVKHFAYYPGKYMVAWDERASHDNEQTHIFVESDEGKVFFKQIVGVLARRLVWDIKEGDSVDVGQRFGMMKFGSRMDIIVNKESDIYVKVGESTVAGESILCKLKK